MAANQTIAALNRPVFTQTAFDSAAMTVLTTLVHQFPAAGQYEVFVRRGRRLAGRLAVHVTREAAERQRNIDMTAIADPSSCGCRDDGTCYLAVGGFLGFYASKGSGRFHVVATAFDDKKKAKDTVLDSSKVIPAGDFFAITFVRPGVYHLIEQERQSKREVRVRVPRDAPDYRPDQPTLAALGRDGKFERRPIDIYSGQSVVVQCTQPSHIEARLVDPGDTGDPIGPGTFRFKKPPPRGAGSK